MDLGRGREVQHAVEIEIAHKVTRVADVRRARRQRDVAPAVPVQVRPDPFGPRGRGPDLVGSGVGDPVAVTEQERADDSVERLGVGRRKWIGEKMRVGGRRERG